MKKLAKLTALLLTGVMLLLLASCGAAPGGGAIMTPEETAAKQEILNALNEYRTSNGVNEVWFILMAGIFPWRGKAFF